MRDVPRTRQRARQGPARPHLGGGPGQRLHTLPRGRQLAALRRRPLPPVHRRPGARHASQARREAPPARVRQRTERGLEGFLERDAMRILDSLREGGVGRDREVERAVEAAAREEPARASLWLSLAAQRRKLGLSARRLLQRSGTEMQALALRGVPDLRLDWLRRLSHAALIAQGAESWTGTLGGHRVHRYAFAGRGKDRPVLLLHGLGGSADSVATLVPPLLPISARVVLLELPGHGRSPQPPAGPLAAREYGDVVTAAVDRLYAEYGKVALVGNSLGGAHGATALPPHAVAVLAGGEGLRPRVVEPDGAAHPRRRAQRSRPFARHRRALGDPRAGAHPLGRAGSAAALDQRRGLPAAHPRSASGADPRLRTHPPARVPRLHPAPRARIHRKIEDLTGSSDTLQDRVSRVAGGTGRKPGMWPVGRALLRKHCCVER